MTEIEKGLLASLFLTIVTIFIKLASESKSRASFFFTFETFVYFIILCIGYCCTTLGATRTVNAVFNEADYPGFMWFWYSIAGVFGFQFILQNINITFLGKGFLTLDTWMNMAQDSAVEFVIRAVADRDIQDKQDIANRLIEKTGHLLPTYVLQELGQEIFSKLEHIIEATPGTNRNLYLALALAEAEPRKAKAIIDR